MISRRQESLTPALQIEIARQSRGRLDMPWSLPTNLAVLLERLLSGPGLRQAAIVSTSSA